jgi:hypothetical protein
MEKLAIQIQPVRVSKTTRGFNIVQTLRPEKPEIEVAVEQEDEEFEECGRGCGRRT